MKEKVQTEEDEFGGFAAAGGAPTTTDMAQSAPPSWGALEGMPSGGAQMKIPMSSPMDILSQQQQQQQQQQPAFQQQHQTTSMSFMPQQQQPTPIGMSLTAPPLQQTMGFLPQQQQQPSVPQTADWGAFSGAAPAPADPFGQPQPMAMPTTSTNDFGGFTAAAPSTTTTTDDSFGVSVPAPAEPSGWDALDALAADTPVAPPPVLPSVEPEPANEEDDFGDFASSASVPEQSAATQPPSPQQELQLEPPQPAATLEPSGWDALDALAGNTLDPAPPALAPLDQPAVGETSPTANNDDEDNFGDFASGSSVVTAPAQPVQSDWSAATPVISATGESVPTTQSNSLGGTSSLQLPTEQPLPTSGWDALDALADPTPPSPTLPEPSKAAAVEMPDESPATDEHDDFGDIAAAEPTANAGWDALDALAGSTEAPPPVLPAPTFPEPEEALAFTADSLDKPDESGQNTFDDDNEVDFGGFLSVETAESAPVNGDDTHGKAAPLTLETASEPMATADFQNDTDDFGDFASSCDVSQGLENTASGTYEQQNEPIPTVPPKTAIFGARSDSAYYSARASSVQSEVSSLDEFVDAVQNENDYRGTVPKGINSGLMSSGNVTAGVSSDDTFAAFETIAPSQPDLPPLSSFERKEISDATPNGLDQGDTSEMVAQSEVTITQAGLGSSPEADAFDDSFGDFEGVSSENVTTEMVDTGASTEADQEILSTVAESTPEESPQMGTETGVDLFGSFNAPQVAQGGKMTENTGVFDAFAPEESDIDGRISVGYNIPQQSPEFGDFGDAPPFDVEDDFEDFDNVPKQSADNDFGDFGAANAATTDDAGDDFGAPQQNAADDFGDFVATNIATTDNAEDDFSNFGHFSGFENNESEVKPSSDENPLPHDDFGEFDAVPTQNGFSDDDGDDWEAFQNTSQTQPPQEIDPQTEDLLKLRDNILATTTHIPESLLQCLGTNAGHVDFMSCFEANIGVEIPVSSERKNRVGRCLQVTKMLSSYRSKLAAAYWTAALSVAKYELSNGISLCNEAKALKKKERSIVSGPFGTYVNGLGEMIRVIRMIVATIGDMLMLDATSLFTVDTFASSWCSLSILKEALEIERMWKLITDEVSKLGLSKTGIPNISTIPELRLVSANFCASPDLLCQFTLQPFAKGIPTAMQVEWGNGHFAACAANFLANKCSFFSIDDEC